MSSLKAEDEDAGVRFVVEIMTLSLLGRGLVWVIYCSAPDSVLDADHIRKLFLEARQAYVAFFHVSVEPL